MDSMAESKETLNLKTALIKEPSDLVPIRILDLSALSCALGQRFTIEKEIGRGGMGVVYLALDNQLKRHVAIKTIFSQTNIPKKSIDRFRFEALIAASLKNPNIIQVYEIIEFQNQPIYIM
jgi:serine/threonine protein kinase